MKRRIIHEVKTVKTTIIIEEEENDLDDDVRVRQLKPGDELIPRLIEIGCHGTSIYDMRNETFDAMIGDQIISSGRQSLTECRADVIVWLGLAQ